MSGEPDTSAPVRPTTYCVVPRALAPKLHDALRRHFEANPQIEVVVERRGGDRRSESRDRRTGSADVASDRRRIRNVTGRRAGDRRASVAVAEAPPLPRVARRHAERLTFVHRLEPAGERAEDLDTARLVIRFQAGDRDAFATVYMRYFDRVYSYLRVVLNDRHRAEDAAQHVFMQALDALPRYERRSQPFRAWLFSIVRNHALDELRKSSRVELMEADEFNRRREGSNGAREEEIGWISDRELLLFVERLPLLQRQVLLMRYLMDLTFAQIATILDRSSDDVRGIHARALRYLRTRLSAIRHDPTGGGRIRMRRAPKHAPVLRLRRFVLR